MVGEIAATESPASVLTTLRRDKLTLGCAYPLSLRLRLLLPALFWKIRRAFDEQFRAVNGRNAAACVFFVCKTMTDMDNVHIPAGGIMLVDLIYGNYNRDIGNQCPKSCGGTCRLTKVVSGFGPVFTQKSLAIRKDSCYSRRATSATF